MSYPKGKPREELVGKRYGRLLVIRKTDSTLRGNVVWECKCDCGNTRYVPTTSLNSGNTTSCGCLTKENQHSAVTLPEGQAAFNRLYKCYKDNAKKQGRAFELSKESFRELTSANCHYCGAQPANFVKEPHFNGIYPYNGIDRTDSMKNYTIENTVPCCKTCNIAKHTMSVEEFYDWVTRVYNYKRI